MVGWTTYRRLVVSLLAAAVAFDAAMFTEVFGEEPEPGELIDRATAAGQRGDSASAIRLATLAIEKDAGAADAYYVRGRERFRSGSIRDSVADFDKYVALRPAAAPRQWERGIACYYAGMYSEGAAQFESYQNYDGHDVENSVWRFLCLVPTEGVPRAQASMLAIDKDTRVPMMQIYDLYRGKLQPQDVLQAAQAGDPPPDVLAGRLFYAHLYLGLWYEVTGDEKQARHYIELAADEKLKDNRRLNRYMWDVARLHLRLLRGELKRPAEDSNR